MKSDVFIVREKVINDGTTGGKTIYMDNHGNWWQDAEYTKENAPTGVNISTFINGYRVDIG